MPAGTPYFAWIDPTETTFNSGHMRWDENIFSFKLSQDEGDPAALTLVVRRPRNISGNPIGLLGPGRKFWCWFSLDCDGTNLIKFRGRLVGTPTNFFEELVTLDFVAKPVDIVAQKQSLAASLAVLPYYDPALIDPTRRVTATTGDPDTVLEAYSAIWHFDRETHIITTSDEITGEDGTVNFDASSAPHTVLYDGLGSSLTTGPLARASVTAEFKWTQGSGGTVDLTSYLLANWPAPVRGPTAVPGAIQLDESNWPKAGASLGGGWSVASSTAKNLLDFTVKTESFESQINSTYPDGDTVQGTSSKSISIVNSPVNMIEVVDVITKDDVKVTTQSVKDTATGFFQTFVSNFSRNTTELDARVSLQEIKPTLVATYAANRGLSERVSITVTAHVQPILVDPATAEILQLPDISSANLSEAIDGNVPMGDPSRQSYVATARGDQSIQYLIYLLRANLLKRARVVEITFVPQLARMPEITLRKSAYLVEPRIGTATGKIIAYSVALDGSDGHVKCEVQIGCAIGYGGTHTTTAGTGTYVTAGYVTGGYQQVSGASTAIGGGSIGYTPPSPVVPAGSINFQGTLTAADVIDTPLSVQYGTVPPASSVPPAVFSNDPNVQKTVTDFINAYWLPQYETQAKFKLKDVTGDLLTDYTIATTPLEIPTGYNLEAT